MSRILQKLRTPCTWPNKRPPLLRCLRTLTWLQYRLEIAWPCLTMKVTWPSLLRFQLRMLSKLRLSNCISCSWRSQRTLRRPAWSATRWIRESQKAPLLLTNFWARRLWWGKMSRLCTMRLASSSVRSMCLRWSYNSRRILDTRSSILRFQIHAYSPRKCPRSVLICLQRAGLINQSFWLRKRHDADRTDGWNGMRCALCPRIPLSGAMRRRIGDVCFQVPRRRWGTW